MCIVSAKLLFSYTQMSNFISKYRVMRAMLAFSDGLLVITRLIG